MSPKPSLIRRRPRERCRHTKVTSSLLSHRMRARRHSMSLKRAGGKADKHGSGQQPEALATFAEAARHGGKKPGDIGLHATPASKPLPGNLKNEEETAAKILNENATGKDQGGEAAARELP